VPGPARARSGSGGNLGCDAALREGLSVERYERIAAPAEANQAQAEADLDALLAEGQAVEATLEVAGAEAEFVERIAALRAAVAGEVTNAESLRATQVALRRVFDGFILHRADSPDAPGRVDA